jgi:hypothetical protein
MLSKRSKHGEDRGQANNAMGQRKTVANLMLESHYYLPNELLNGSP